MAPSVKSLVSELASRGPHRVQRGDLALAGQPGAVFTPSEGLGLPAVAFAHGWMSGVDNYLSLLQHLASWGIVAAAPNTERGPFPSHLALATDLQTTLDICTGIRLGHGDISVHPDKLAFAGHGMGAGVAVIAAAQRPVAAVAALFSAPTAPKSEAIAPKITAPALILAGATDISAIDSNAKDLAAAWGGEAVLRSIDKASGNGLLEGRRVLGALGVGKAEKTTQKTARAILTGFLLYTLTGDKKYSDFAEADSSIPKTQLVDPFAVEEVAKKKSPLGQISQLRGK
ncbi:dienelactone hydrolase family protein [Antrihabitans sp. NCIMB 15449]|uniref:Dienelactone hydrolase family protein n=1 Tax=Antrihabitans spumae TaxID=3373370 RepID=A0ABW7JF63_9NOCA